MTRQRVGSILTALAAVAFLATAALHSTGYDSVTQLAMEAPADFRALVPALWLAFSFDLTVVGLIVGVVAFRPSAASRLILLIAAACPTSAAGLQLWFLGFIPPTALLLGLGALTLLAAGVLPGAVSDATHAAD